VNKNWLWIALAFLMTLPGLYVRYMGLHLTPPEMAVIFCFAILGAAFLISWGAEAAETEVSQSLALAALALIAVLPEYSVDMYFAWTAAHRPEYTAFAAANMTGANRLLIGFGWSLVVILFWLRTRQKGVVLHHTISIELSFLVLATLYSFILPLKGTIDLLDGAILVGLFALYIWRAGSAEVEEVEVFGPAALVCSLPKVWKILSTIFFFAFSGVVIFLSAEPFAEGLIQTGRLAGIDEFILVQWLAPLASEAPEIFVATVFTWRLLATNALGALISSKVNQWTLLIGCLPIAYSISGMRAGTLVLDSRQIEEILLTAAQSAFAIAILANLDMSLKEAFLVLGLFATQLFFTDPTFRFIYSGLYIILTIIILVNDRSKVRALWNCIQRDVLGRKAVVCVPEANPGEHQ